MKEYKQSIIDTLMTEVLQREENLITGIALKNQIFLSIQDVPEALNENTIAHAVKTAAQINGCPCERVEIEREPHSNDYSVVIHSGPITKKECGDDCKDEKVIPLFAREDAAAMQSEQSECAPESGKVDYNANAGSFFDD